MQTEVGGRRTGGVAQTGYLLELMEYEFRCRMQNHHSVMSSHIIYGTHCWGGGGGGGFFHLLVAAWLRYTQIRSELPDV